MGRKKRAKPGGVENAERREQLSGLALSELGERGLCAFCLRTTTKIAAHVHCVRWTKNSLAKVIEAARQKDPADAQASRLLPLLEAACAVEPDPRPYYHIKCFNRSSLIQRPGPNPERYRYVLDVVERVCAVIDSRPDSCHFDFNALVDAALDAQADRAPDKRTVHSRLLQKYGDAVLVPRHGAPLLCFRSRNCDSLRDYEENPHLY